jgi:replication factor C large subunit
MLLCGPTGCGKTAAVHAIARDCNFELIEMNASDLCSKVAILSLLGTAAKQRSLFSSGKILLVDDVDCLSGQADRGAIAALEEVIATTAFPLFITCQDMSNKKLKPLAKSAQVVTFAPLEYTDIYAILQQICAKEDVAYDEAALKTVARQVAGDLRAAINDLQLLALYKSKITLAMLDVLGYRNKEESVADALVKIFKIKNAIIARDALDAVQEDLDHVLLWIDENLPKEYTDPEALVRAYNALSRADVFRGRIRRWQHWRFLVYVHALMSAGVAVSKDERNKEPIQYEQTKRFLTIWLAKQKYAKRQAIAEKIAAQVHTSSSHATQHVVPYLKVMFRNKAMALALAEEYDLDAEEVGWLQK